jgi:hypothetical protein
MTVELVDLDILQDSFAGRVRAYCYNDVPEPEETDTRWNDVVVPFAVMMWCDGLDYDENGHAHFDDYPQNVPHSYHTTRKGAESEIAWLEFLGHDVSGFSIEANYLTYEWDLQYKPIKE